MRVRGGEDVDEGEEGEGEGEGEEGESVYPSVWETSENGKNVYMGRIARKVTQVEGIGKEVIIW